MFCHLLLKLQSFLGPVSLGWCSHKCFLVYSISPTLVEKGKLWGMRGVLFCNWDACMCAKSRPALCNPIWTVAHWAPLSMEFFRQEYWSGLPCPPPGDPLDPEIKPLFLTSPELSGGIFTTSITWEAHSLNKTLAKPFLWKVNIFL